MATHAISAQSCARLFSAPEGVVPASTEVGELGSKNEMAHIMHDMKAVVDQIVDETYEGLTISRTLPADSARN